MRLVNASSWESNLEQTFFTAHPSPPSIEECRNHYHPFAWVTYEDNQIIAARDHFGLEPFYYFFDGQQFIFGSNIPDIIRQLSKPPELNQDRCLIECFSYRNFQYPPYDKATFHQSIYRVTPGHIQTIQNGQINERSFWALNPEAPSVYYRDPRDYFVHFASLLEEAVHFHSQDPALGLELSGGLDSSSLFIACQKLNRHPICFTHSQAENSEENHVVKALISQFNWSDKHHVINADSFDPLRVFDWCAHQFSGAPPYLFFILANNLHQTVISKQCTTLLSGFGADECISSYALPHVYFPQAMTEQSLITNWRELKLHQQNCHGKTSNTLRRAWQLFNYRYAWYPLKNPRILRCKSIRHQEYQALQGIHAHGIRMRVEYSAIIAKSLGFNYRYPFLYPPLVEYCFQLPIEQKRSQGMSRLLSRQYLSEHTQLIFSKKIKMSGAICHASLQKCLAQYTQGEFSQIFQNLPFQDAWFDDPLIHGQFLQRVFSYMFHLYLESIK